MITYTNFSVSGLVEQMAHGEHDEEIGRLEAMLIKKNASLNLMREEMRHVMEIFDKTFPDARAAAEAEVRWGPPPELKGFAKWMPNASGIQAATAGARGLLIVQHRVRFKALFVPRAMQVKIAMLRWNATHPQQWPAALTELVPDYLPAVPEDPWTGRPLLWDQATRTIFAVGSDYTPDRPKRDPYNRSTLLDTVDSPGLLVKPARP